MNKNKIFKIIAAVGILVVLIVYIKFFTSNTTFDKEEVFVEIPTGSQYDEVQKIISPYVKNMSDFEFIAQLRSYPKNVKPGRFLLKKGMSSFSIVRALRLNVPVKLAFNNQEKVQDLFVRLASQIEPDTTKLKDIFTSNTSNFGNSFLILFHENQGANLDEGYDYIGFIPSLFCVFLILNSILFYEGYFKVEFFFFSLCKI